MLAFTNANLIDGTGSGAVRGTAVLVDGKKIKAIGKDVTVPDDATVIDLNGKTLMPGLIESHAHLGGRDYPPGLDNAKNSFNYAPMRDYALASGVTTIRSCGDFMHDSLDTRDRIDQGFLRGPRLVCSGKQFQRRDAHPSRTIWGNDPETCENAGAFPENPEEARALVRELVATGVDYIKIIVAHSFIFIYPEKFAALPDDVLEAIIDEAHKHGIWVMCHIDSAPDAIKVIGYGADEINHLIAMGLAELPDEATYDELFRLMVERGTWFVPTITIVRTYNHLLVERNIPATIDGYFIPHYRKAYEAGVRRGAAGLGRSGSSVGTVAARGTQGIRLQPGDAGPRGHQVRHPEQRHHPRHRRQSGHHQGGDACRHPNRGRRSIGEDRQRGRRPPGDQRGLDCCRQHAVVGSVCPRMLDEEAQG